MDFKKLRLLSILFLCLYMGLILVYMLIITPKPPTWFITINIIPFKTMYYYVESLFTNDIDRFISFINLGNYILLFIPFGVLLPLVSKLFRKVWSVLLTCLCISIVFEVLQVITKHGIGDIDDIILAVLGGLLGYAIFRFGACKIVKKINVYGNY